jgi:hypothetical protein
MQMLQTRNPAVLLLSFVQMFVAGASASIAVSCSGDSDGGPPGPGRTGGDYRRTFCTAIIGRYVSCGVLDASQREQSIAECQGASGISPAFRDDFLQDFAACIDALMCDNLEGADDVLLARCSGTAERKPIAPGGGR